MHPSKGIQYFFDAIISCVVMEKAKRVSTVPGLPSNAHPDRCLLATIQMAFQFFKDFCTVSGLSLHYYNGQRNKTGKDKLQRCLMPNIKGILFFSK